MAYFNLKLIEQRKIHPVDAFLLQLIHQNRAEDASEAIALCMDDESLQRLYAFGLITMIKGTKKMNEFQKLRLTKKGKKWYRDFQSYQTVENDFKLFETLKEIYLAEEKEIGSEKKTLSLIAWFRVETGFSHKEIWLIAKKFVQDEERMEYSKMLEKVFWSSTNHFQTQPKLEDSKLYLYYEKYKQQFDAAFKKMRENEKST
jgi:hypothetical protein